MKIKKKSKCILALILTVAIIATSLIIPQNAYANQGGLATDDSNVHNVEYGTETSDSNYAFTLTSYGEGNTTVSFWQKSGSSETAYTGNIYYQDTYYREDAYVGGCPVIYPTSDSQSGNIGCWVYNCGVHYGDQVDVKLTFSWESYTPEGASSTVKPFIGVNYGNKGKLGMQFRNRSYEVKYELYTSSTSSDKDAERNFEGKYEKPLTADHMSFTFGDIDADQEFGFKFDGTVQEIECLNTCRVYIDEIGTSGGYSDYYWLYAPDDSSSDELRDSIRFELNNVHEFNIVYCPGSIDDGYKQDSFREKNDWWLLYMTEELEGVFSRIGNGGHFTNSGGSYVPDESRAIGTAWGYFDSTAYGPYEMSDPYKRVSDSSPDKDGVPEENVTENTLTEADNDTYTYHIYYQVPLENSDFYYDSLTLSDTLPDCLDYVSSTVKVVGTDANASFTTSSSADSNNRITATANNCSSSSFYNNTYDWQITVKVNRDVLEADGAGGTRLNGSTYVYKNGNDYTFIIYNHAQATVARSSTSLANTSGTTETNEVITNLYEEERDIVVQKIWIDEDNYYNTRPDDLEVYVQQDTQSGQSGTSGTRIRTVSNNGDGKWSKSGNTWTATVTVPSLQGTAGIDDNRQPYEYHIVEDYTNPNVAFMYDLDWTVSSGYSRTTDSDGNLVLQVSNVIWPDSWDTPYDDPDLVDLDITKAIYNDNGDLATADDFEQIKMAFDGSDDVLDFNGTYTFPITIEQWELVGYDAVDASGNIIGDGNTSGAVRYKGRYEQYPSGQAPTFTGYLTWSAGKGVTLSFSDLPVGKYSISEGSVQYFELLGITPTSMTGQATYGDATWDPVVWDEDNYTFEFDRGTGTSDSSSIDDGSYKLYAHLSLEVDNVIDTFRPYDHEDSANNYFTILS